MYNDYRIYRGRAFASDDELGLCEFSNPTLIEDRLKLENSIETLSDTLADKKKKHKKYEKDTTVGKFIRLILKYFGGVALIFLGTLILKFAPTSTPVWDIDLVFWSRAFLFTCTFFSMKSEFKEFLRNTKIRDGLVLVISYLEREIERLIKELEELNARIKNEQQVVDTVGEKQLAVLKGMSNILGENGPQLEGYTERMNGALKELEDSYDEENNRGIVSLRGFNDEYQANMNNRLKRILMLGEIKDELLKLLDQETVDSKLKERGFSEEELELGKSIVMEMKEKRESN